MRALFLVSTLTLALATAHWVTAEPLGGDWVRLRARDGDTPVVAHRRHAAPAEVWRFEVPPTPYGIDTVLRLEPGESVDVLLEPGFHSVRAWPDPHSAAALARPPAPVTELLLRAGDADPDAARAAMAASPPAPPAVEEQQQLDFRPAAEVAAFDVERALQPRMLAALRNGTVAALLAEAEEVAPRVYALDLLAPAFCEALLRELDAAHAAALPGADRPNSMNRYGLLLRQIGLGPMAEALVAEAVAPFARLLFPDYGGDALDSALLHAFSIGYAAAVSGAGDGTRDADLARHMDASEVTLNVCLGRGEFRGGEVVFAGARDAPGEPETVAVPHRPGVALLHAGQHFHSARALEAGERDNVVLWMRSQAARQSPAERFILANVKKS